MAKQKIKTDVSTEEKIKQAARRLFTERGFDAVKTRDIAEEAGINLALINYYFRSKQKLFDIVMIENMEQFIDRLNPILENQELTTDDMLNELTASYIDLLLRNPDLPFFIMKEMRGDKNKLHYVKGKMTGIRNNFIKRVGGNIPNDALGALGIGHLTMNFMSMILFPFIARPLMMEVNDFSKKEFDSLMEERKKMIPIWFKAIMTKK
jgi:AcrR family transcriptional regulator